MTTPTSTSNQAGKSGFANLLSSDIAGLIGFLVGPCAGAITGQVVVQCAGLSLT